LLLEAADLERKNNAQDVALAWFRASPVSGRAPAAFSQWAALRSAA